MAIWSNLWPSGIFYRFLVYLNVIWCILPVLVGCSKKNLATLIPTSASDAFCFQTEIQNLISNKKGEEEEEERGEKSWI
jgi:hypothetical protein